ncbi:MAG TPA: hypothetical protein PKB02_09815 [Anaerohalosphaeraceae bacterium]|nr:hypothetical protein [Anaerohalosphaeraceae bacterium]
MEAVFRLDGIPLWGIFILAIVTVLASIGIGTLLGRHRRTLPDHESESSLGTIIGAMLGLLAFMLAFTFGMAADRFQTRKQLLLDEVNTIGTTYLRAGLLQEPHGSEVQALLRHYVDFRAGLASQPPADQVKGLKELILRSEELQSQMWLHAIALAKADRSSEIDALFISSLNELMEIHNSRATTISYRIPPAIWYVLSCITILSMVTVGYQEGLSGKRSVKMGIVLAFTFSAVVFLIADLDRATGTLRVNQKPLFELQRRIQEAAGPDGAAEKAMLLIDPVAEILHDHHAAEILQ